MKPQMTAMMGAESIRFSAVVNFEIRTSNTIRDNSQPK
jgi:hypothetical protein